MKNSAGMWLTKLFKLSLVLGVLVLGCSQTWGDDLSTNVFYTQYAYRGIAPSVGTVHLQYTFSTSTLVLTGNTTLISGATDSSFGGADDILINGNNDDLLIAGGGGIGAAGSIYQVTETGARKSLQRDDESWDHRIQFGGRTRKWFKERLLERFFNCD